MTATPPDDHPLEHRASERPVIGVSGPARGGWAAWLAVRFAIWRAGGRARRITPADHGPDDLPDLDALDGLVMTGGGDIEPRRYGAQATRPMRIDPPRDALELALVRRAREARLPTLGICRGMQIMAVVTGGRLIEHIEPEARAHRSPLPFWRAHIEPGTRIARLLGRHRIRINKIHHQAIDDPGPALRVVARDTDGLVQAIEAPDRAFFLGVQWHPEYMQYMAPHRRLIGALVRAAGGAPAPSAHPVPSLEVGR